MQRVNPDHHHGTRYRRQRVATRRIFQRLLDTPASYFPERTISGTKDAWRKRMKASEHIGDRAYTQHVPRFPTPRYTQHASNMTNNPNPREQSVNNVFVFRSVRVLFYRLDAHLCVRGCCISLIVLVVHSSSPLPGRDGRLTHL